MDERHRRWERRAHLQLGSGSGQLPSRGMGTSLLKCFQPEQKPPPMHPGVSWHDASVGQTRPKSATTA